MPFILNPFTGKLDYYQASSSTGGGAVTAELPSSGTCNGSNKVFVFPHAVNFVTWEGAVQNTLNTPADISVVTNTVTFTTAPPSGADLPVNWHT